MRIALLFLLTAVPAWAEHVDVELVLGVDTSRSMDYDELALQREGYARALEHRAFIHVVRSGVAQQIALTYFDWGGPGNSDVILPWTIIRSEEDAANAAAILRGSPVKNLRGTGISTAILKGIELIETNDITSERQIIDISGDGPNNVGPPVTEARDEAAAKGIEVNGLPMMLKEPGATYNIGNLDIYYQDCVITGPTAFVIAVQDVDRLATSILQKLVTEIAGKTPEPRIWRAAQTDCLIGEKLREQRFLDNP